MLDRFPPQQVRAFLNRLESAMPIFEDHCETNKDHHSSFVRLWDSVGQARYKRVSQESSLIHLLDSHGMIDESLRKTNILELGCGTATLSWHLAMAKPNSRLSFFLLDRQSFRSRTRVDYRIRALVGGHPNVTRWTMDMRDMKTEMLPCAPEEGVLFLSKHFCGEATDMALEHAVKLKRGNVNMQAPVRICLATCCHGTMKGLPFGGEDYMQSVLRGPLTPQDWDMLYSATSWATLGVDEDEDFLCPNSFRTRAQKRRLGNLAKLIIDESRVESLKQHGFVNAKVVLYTDATVENRVIIA